MKINPYLNFTGNCEEAFVFYKSVFGGDFLGLSYFGDMPAGESGNELSAEEKKYVTHIALPIGNDVLMGSDVPTSMTKEFTLGSNNYVLVSPESVEEGLRIFTALSEEATVEMPYDKVFWGAHYGSLQDKFGVRWMVNYEENWNGDAATYPRES